MTWCQLGLEGNFQFRTRIAKKQSIQENVYFDEIHHSAVFLRFLILAIYFGDNRVNWLQP